MASSRTISPTVSRPDPGPSPAVCPTDPQALTRAQWLRYGPFLAQIVVIRRCNLSCGYCSEFDKVSEPVPTATLLKRIEKLRALRSWAVCLTGGEPTLHPDIPLLLGEMRGLGIRRRIMITNGLSLSRESIETFNEAGLTDLQISVDGVVPNETTQKVLKHLRPKLELLAEHARFDVVMSGVIGSSPPAEALEVVDFARRMGFVPRILLIHDDRGRLHLDAEERDAYRAVKRAIGKRASEAHNYRDRLIDTGAAPFRCRSGARYLYVDEFGMVHWCSAQRDAFAKDLLEYSYEDLRAQFHAAKGCNATCTVGCARTASAYDQWRPQ